MPNSHGRAARWSWVLALGLSSAAYAAPSEVPDIPFEKYQLSNGLSVILHQDARLPLVAVSVWYDVGALHERTGRSGFAHLFEHMMFQGTKHVAEDQHFAYLQKAGATLVNGTTAYDRTNYFETVPKNELELALWLESDRMGFLLGALNKQSLDNQIEVVKNERRQSVENQPYGLMEEKLMQTLYPKPHPYFGNVIGSMEDLSAATVDDVRDFFLTYYSPANATIAIAGDFDPTSVKALVEKYFGALKGRSKPMPPKLSAPKIEQTKVIEFAEPVGTLPKISMAWMAPSAYKEGTAAIDLLAHVISGTKSSRLDKKVSYDDQIAQSVTAYLDEHKDGSVFQIELVVRPGRTLDEAQAAMEQVLQDLEKNPPTEAELARARNAQETRTFRALEILGGFSGRAEQLQAYNLYLGDPGRIGWDIERYRKVSTKDLEAVRKQILDAPRIIIRATPSSRQGGAQ